MKNIEIGSHDLWDIGSYFGITSDYLQIHADTVINTWIVLLVIAVLIICLRVAFSFENGRIRHAFMTLIDYFMDLSAKTLGKFHFGHFSLITSLFIFILICNYISLIPWIKEPTEDLNTTFALGILGFIYIQVYAIKVHGIGSYLKEYFSPFFLMFPLNVIGKLANIVSISFRLYGNIFGGGIISAIWLGFIKGSVPLESFALFSGFNLGFTAFFVLFVGALQAFVFSMLTLTYLSIAIQQEDSA